MEYLNEIIHFLKKDEAGIWLDLDPDIRCAIIFTDNSNINEAFAEISNNVYFVTDESNKYNHLLAKYPGLKIISGDLTNTNLDNNSIDFVLTDSKITQFDRITTRNELKRISTDDFDVAIITDDIVADLNDEFLFSFYAGSGYKVKEFIDNKSYGKIYYGSIGFNAEELKAKEIIEFIEACERYYKVIEDFRTYSVKDFLYNVQKTLVEYYSKGFELKSICGNFKNTKDGYDEGIRKQVNFRFYLDSLTDFLDSVEPYFSNFSPYPDENDKEIYKQSLSCDLAEIYEDLKSNLIAYKTGNIYDKQDVIWDWKFNWHGHTGDHWTFAVRAIHWKLQDLEYEN